MREFASRCTACQHAHTVTLDEGFKDHGCREHCGCPTQSTALQPPEDLGDYLKNIGGLGGLEITDKGRAHLGEIATRAKFHLSQFKLKHGVKGFLFVDDAWIASRTQDEHYQRETDPEIIDYIKETWVDNGIKDSIGTTYSPCEARPHCVIAPYT